jgi:hypothetical protein
MRSISACSRLATSISFAPTSGQTPRYTPSLTLCLATRSGSSAPSSTLATSLSRTTAPAAVGDDQVVELPGRPQVGVGQHVDLDLVPLRLPDGGDVVVPPERRLDVARDRFRAASRSGSIHTRIATCRPPSIVTRCTPSIVDSRGCRSERASR